MTSGFRLLPAGLEEGQFRRLPEGGWLFATANPWFFGSRRIYLLTETQKPVFAERVRRGVYIRLLLLIPFLLISVIAFLEYPTLREFRSGLSWLVFLAACLVFGFVLNLGDYLNVRSLLNDVPRSSQKMPSRNLMREQGQAMSIKALAIFTLIFVMGFLINGYNALTFQHGGGLAAIGAIGMLVLAFLFGKMLQTKLRTRQTENDAAVTPDQLAARLSRIERSSAVQASGLVALTVLALVAGIMIGNLFDRPSNPPAEAFNLKNSKGDIVASLRTGSDDLPLLALWDGNKKLRAAVGVSKSGAPFLSLTDTDGKIRMSMTMVTDTDVAKQNAILQFLDDKGKSRIWAGVDNRGPHLWMYDDNNMLKLSATVDNDGAHIRTLDALGKEIPAPK
jgi:hypothetical protein